MTEVKYIIVSLENWCVFSFSRSEYIANAVAEGFGDTVILAWNRHSNDWFDRIKDWDLFYRRAIYVDSARSTMIELPASSLSESWLATQEILRIRQSAFFAWENLTRGALTRMSRHIWSDFDRVCEEELALCDPGQNRYTPLLEDYADQVSMPVAHLYKDLKLRLESDRVAKFRAEILSDKWKRRINTAVTAESVAAAKQEMVREFWHNCRL